MKKLLIVTRNMKAGGAERVIAQLSNYLVEQGVNCTIVTINDSEIFYDLNKEVNLIPIGKRSNNIYIDKILKYREVRKLVKSEKPDVVLSLPEEIAIFVIPALLGTKVPIVVSERNNPWVMPWKKPTRFLRKVFYPFASGYIFQTKQAATFFSKRIQEKGIVLPNPLDLNRIPDAYKGERNKVIVSAGRLEKQKNFSLLIQSFAKFNQKYPEYTLTVYGEGRMRAELENLASELLPKGKISFPGQTEDLLEKIKDASMFVLSSDFEGMPNVIIEAMAVGMPVISTDCPSGGPSDLIDNKVNGILTPVGDVNEMYKAMCKIASSEEFARSLGENAQDIKVKLDSTNVIEKWRNYLNECCERKQN
ncbi:glycosyltransferase family 4 protein [Globicatella sulfidifaciens]|uniref:Glycosyltransferase family 4 protein n=1 Tax=Globicatella sulfidifaciens TaxID=136093 RepID=A0A7X8C3R0_9LACT|nr:glycosyltransferase family 4 protein [Globicatella sulfidifaciens]NLJ18277.1 glycosyltransferase family 4 protein [Globicatella sulfidifaciens]